MYRLSKDEDLSFLLEAELLQVCVGRNELILNFDRGVRVTILSDFAVTSSGGPSNTYQDAMSGAPAIFPMIHDRVVLAGATEGGHLSLTFRSGMYLEVRDTSAEFESFWISNGDRQIIV